VRRSVRGIDLLADLEQMVQCGMGRWTGGPDVVREAELARARIADRRDPEADADRAAATGTSPGRWLLLARLARARELLETTALDIERVTGACGFGSADTLRHHFRRELRTSPSRYRATFRGG
jgi:methylphosphotriester-DNA--protein-cysteine methyltransferase